MRHGIVYQTARTDLLDLEGRALLEKRRFGKTFYFTPVHDLDAALERLTPPEPLPGYVVY